MKLHFTPPENKYLITGIDDEGITVNQTRYSHSLIITPNQLNVHWNISNFNALTISDFEEIMLLQPEVVLLGTGKQHHFIHPKISTPLSSKNISLDCMTTAAACRTYNILLAEGRNVLAMLIVE